MIARLLLPGMALVALVSSAMSQETTPTPTATSTPTTPVSPTSAPEQILAPTGLRTEGRMITNPPTGPLRQFVIWMGIPDLAASYQLERSLGQNESERDYQLLATVPSTERRQDGTFEYDTSGGLPAARYVCYRVRAIVGSTAGPYSTESCIGPIPTGVGGGAELTPTTSPTPGAPPTGNGGSAASRGDSRIPMSVGAAALLLSAAVFAFKRAR